MSFGINRSFQHTLRVKNIGEHRPVRSTPYSTPNLSDVVDVLVLFCWGEIGKIKTKLGFSEKA